MDIGRQTALRWIAEGSALARSIQKVELSEGCGIVARGDDAGVRAWLGRYGVDCEVTPRSLLLPNELTYPRTLFWDGRLKLRADLIGVGFGLLDRWEVALPLYDHHTLAREVGTPDERARTESLLADLRVPVYQPGVMFVRDSEGTRALLSAYDQERRKGDERLGFLRALWQVKPLVLALPASWIE